MLLAAVTIIVNAVHVCHATANIESQRCDGACDVSVSLLQTSLDVQQIELNAARSSVLEQQEAVTRLNASANDSAWSDNALLQGDNPEALLPNASAKRMTLSSRNGEVSGSTHGAKMESAVTVAVGTATKAAGGGVIIALVILVPCFCLLSVGLAARMSTSPPQQSKGFESGSQRAIPQSAQSLPSSSSPLMNHISHPVLTNNVPTNGVPTNGVIPGSAGFAPAPHPGSGGNIAQYSSPPMSVPVLQGAMPSMMGAGPSSQMAAPAQTMQAPMGAAAGRLVPICQALILPRTEARFLVSMTSFIQMPGGQVEIKGTSGRPLLCAMIGQRDGLPTLALASIGCEDDPRAFIAKTGMVQGGPMEVYGRGGEPYGEIRPGPGGAMLACNGAPVMKIDLGISDELVMSATTMDGNLLGVGRAPPGAGDQWKLVVKPGQDAVLIAACMLALAKLDRCFG